MKAFKTMDSSQQKTTPEKSIGFKKPILIGKIGRLPRKIVKVDPKPPEEKPVEEIIVETIEPQEIVNTPEISLNKTVALPYTEPAWSALPQSSSKNYSFEVLKLGSIIANVDLMEKPFWVFGRLGTCDITMAHPTVSRHHAVLQYRNDSPAERGFYLYDLNSTHGTFLNKLRIKSRVYARVQVGHMIKLGCSSRTYILVGPEEDSEEVSELSVTELKQKRADDILKRELEQREAEEKAKKEAEAKRKRDEEKGVDWGMGDDADEETDLLENPYAQTNNEELYLDDPKKALRGFMEREGLELEYDCSEQGIGQFICKVVLPVDDDKGRAIVAEVIHKGKKKEAVVQCALEACRILDRHGVLRQATHESRKRKAKNWEENDFYDSDDDTFLDRTGTIEKKRQNRMKAKIPQQPETYQSLLEKENKISKEILEIEAQLKDARMRKKENVNKDKDLLDSYMDQLAEVKLDKQKITKLKSDLIKLKLEHATVIKLVNIARPADLPPLVPQYSNQPSNSVTKNKLPIFGKRIKIKVQKPVRNDEFVPENSEDDDDDQIEDTENKETITDKEDMILDKEKQEINSEEEEAIKDKNEIVINKNESLEQNKFENNFYKILELFSKEHKNELNAIFAKLIDENKIKLVEFCRDLSNGKRTKQVPGFEEDLSRIADEFLTEKRKEQARLEEKRKKNNQRRIQHRLEKSEAERMRGYEEDASKEDYNMWVPPQGQTGDGRTSLNEKFGY